MVDDNMEFHKWHMLQLKFDFIENLKNYGRLPIKKLSEKQDLMKKLDDLTRQSQPP